MALVSSSLASGLIAAEDPPAETSAVAADRFSSAFISYFKTAQTTLGPVNPLTCDLPSAKQALVGGITGAFNTTGGNAVANLIGVAILAYLNAGPASLFFDTATSVAIVTPLGTYMSSISTPVAQQQAAKNAVAAAIQTWLASGVQVTFPGPNVSGIT